MCINIYIYILIKLINNLFRNDIQRAGVQYIIDSVVQALLKDPARRYIVAGVQYIIDSVVQLEGT